MNPMSVTGSRTVSEAAVRFCRTSGGETEFSPVYLIEFMTYSDSSLAVLVFEYSPEQDLKNRIQTQGEVIVRLPSPVELCLYEGEGPGMPDVLKPTLILPDQTGHVLRIPVVKFLERPFDSNVRELFPLLPFEVLRNARKVLKDPEGANLEELKAHTAEIRQAVQNAVEEGQTDMPTASALNAILSRLSEHVYGKVLKESDFAAPPYSG